MKCYTCFKHKPEWSIRCSTMGPLGHFNIKNRICTKCYNELNPKHEKRIIVDPTELIHKFGLEYLEGNYATIERWSFRRLR